MANRAELLKKIQARQAEKQAEEKAKWAKMVATANNDPGSIEKKLAYLSEMCAAAADGFENLRENLDLVQAPKDAALKVRVAAARNYAKSFKRIAEEAPGDLASAVQEAYKSLDEIAGTLEMAADQLGIDLDATSVEEAFAEEGKLELEHGEAEGEAMVEDEVPADMEVDEIKLKKDVDDEEKEASGSDWFVSDRDEGGKPRVPEKVQIPRAANSGPGASGFVNDRDEAGKPRSPKKVEIPQSQGKSEALGNKGGSKKRADITPEPAQAFVKEIPQSQGESEVGAAKSSHVRPMKQIVPSGTPAPMDAGAFVEKIPQSQGKSESLTNKQGKVTPARSSAARGRL